MQTAKFVLSASTDTYEITRKTTSGEQETLIIPRRDLPAGCEIARFFLKDSTNSTNELQIAQAVWANWETEILPSLPDDSYPPCSLLVYFGSFSEPPGLEGLAVTSANGLIAKSERQHKQPHPAAWALVPVAVVADIFFPIVVLVTIPAWVPIALIWEHSDRKSEQEAKDKEKAALPLPVAACWTAIDNVMKIARTKGESFDKFEWEPGKETTYSLSTANEIFSDVKPVSIDSRVTLRHGRVQFKVENMNPRWTDADIECGLRGGDVVATRVMLRK